MSKNRPEEPDEFARLRKRVERLERQVKWEREQAPAERARAATLAAGAVALFLSMALPWVREGGGVRFSEEGALSARSLDGYATGWLLLGGALEEGRWLFLLAFAALLLLVGFSLTCLHGAFRGDLKTTVVLAVLTPVLYFVARLSSVPDEDVSAGSGVFVMVVACAVIGLSAGGATEERFRP